MARVNGISEGEATQEVKALFHSQRALFGDVLNTTPIFASRPTIMAGSTALDAGIDASGQIKPPLKYLVHTKNCLDQPLPLLNRHQCVQGGARQRISGEVRTP